MCVYVSLYPYHIYVHVWSHGPILHSIFLVWWVSNLGLQTSWLCVKIATLIVVPAPTISDNYGLCVVKMSASLKILRHHKPRQRSTCVSLSHNESTWANMSQHGTSFQHVPHCILDMSVMIVMSWNPYGSILATAHCMKNSSRCFKFKGAIFLCSISVPPRLPSPNLPILEAGCISYICMCINVRFDSWFS